MADEGTGNLLRRFGGQAVLVAVAVVVVGLVVWLFVGGDEGEEGPLGQADIAIGLIDSHRPEVGEPAPNFALANARHPERIVRLSDFRGRPVVLNWFATWCGPCRAEIPDFQAAFAALEGRVVFLGVNLQESPEEATGMLDDLGATYPALLDEDGAIAAHYRLPGMPTTFFIDAEGIVRAWGAGLIVEETLVAELQKLGLDYTP